VFDANVFLLGSNLAATCIQAWSCCDYGGCCDGCGAVVAVVAVVVVVVAVELCWSAVWL